MPKKKAEPEAAAPPAEQRPTRELYRFWAFYNDKIKPSPKSTVAGVLRNIQRLIDQGLGVDEMALALENYESDEWRRANPRYSKSIFAFFTAENVREWLSPRPKMTKPDPLERVNQFTTDVRPAPAQPVLPTVEAEPEL